MKRAFTVYAVLVLALYSVATLRGWELGTPRRGFIPLTVLVVATCGLIYELVAGTLASYVLGDSVTQFSTVIGVYLSALGLGSYLSKYVQRGLARRFVEVELSVAVLGGASAPILFLSF